MMNTLVRELSKLQKERNWSEARMARELGVSKSTWVHVKAGRRNPGRRVLLGVIRAFPALDIKFYLAQTDDCSYQRGTTSQPGNGAGSDVEAVDA